MSTQELTRLDQIRNDIERIDQQIVALIARRLTLCREVGPLKARAGLAAHLPDRVRLVMARWMEDATSHGIDPELMRHVSALVIAAGEKLQVEAIVDAPAPAS
ncbi:chorismate mutase [Sphingomonas sp. MG17]|jgi:chorismate mutase|uniref:chorismate mutase n=1 Tax=Sphingomonas tagetis TaxID=2949092 RepID=A0A9X2HSN3_9SPHN|nr:chorismate mutase [Sphingomonas tagetis]MCP3732814.1 chorismate mutase [Sphingomonas tagetis]